MWITGIDPKAWVCMHRLHHRYSDGPGDPHSPAQVGIVGVFWKQLQSYELVLTHLICQNPRYEQVVKDLPFAISWPNRKQVWWLPYVLHAALSVAVGVLFGTWLLALAYGLGIMSHPIQGWLVNAFGHAVGYRNFELADQSRNNTVVAWLVFGEGYQNNHHQDATSAKFSYRWWEVDLGYALVRICALLGLLTVTKSAVSDGIGAD